MPRRSTSLFEVADRLTAPARSKLMSRVRSRNTGPEMRVRSLLHRAGYRFRLHQAELPGSPDIVLARYRTAIFVHGCFWHSHDCPRGTLPASNTSFWNDKLEKNRKRDVQANQDLLAAGWDPITIWECELRDENAVLGRVTRALNARDGGAE